MAAGFNCLMGFTSAVLRGSQHNAKRALPRISRNLNRAMGWCGHSLVWTRDYRDLQNTERRKRV
jgi:hypothetical protein